MTYMSPVPAAERAGPSSPVLVHGVGTGLLTPRQYEIVERFALGDTWEEVAFRFGIKRETVWSHRARAEAKYGVSTLIDLFRAIGWLTVPTRSRV